jgi:hypothetical protein
MRRFNYDNDDFDENLFPDSEMGDDEMDGMSEEEYIEMMKLKFKRKRMI